MKLHLSPNFRLALGAAVATLLPIHGRAEATFDISFVTLDRSLQASHAAGKPEALPGEAPKFEDDLVAHNGVAGLRIGGGAPPVRFKREGNLPEPQGCLALGFLDDAWLKTGGTVLLFSADGPSSSGALRLSKVGPGKLRVEGVDGKGNPFSADAALPPDAGDELSVAVTYSETLVKLFLNRRQAAKAPLAAPLRFGETFSFGGAGEIPAVLTAVSISDRPVLPRPAGATTAANQLKDGQQFCGKPSQWWSLGQPKLALEAREPGYVPEPWTPVKQNGAAFEVWNRSYAFGPEGLVGQIGSGKVPILNQPVELQAQIRGKEPLRLAFGPPEQVEAAKGRVHFIRTAKGGALTVRAAFTLEYDGMLLVDLACEPAEGSVVERLSLVIAMAPEVSRFVHYIGAPQKYESQNLAWNSNSIDLPAPGEALKLGFKTYVWIGDNRCGLQWFSSSDQGWWPLDREDCIRIERARDGSARLSLAMIEAPLPSAPKQIKLSFGLMATPVKPLPQRWREWTFSAQYDAFSGERRGNHVIYWPDEWRSMYLDPDPGRAVPEKAAQTAKKVMRDREEGRAILPYWTRIHLPVSAKSLVNPDAARMVELWGTDPNHVRGSSLDLRRVSMDSGWSDYLLWTFQRWKEVFGTPDGLYLDETQPIPNRREASGGGYTAPDGQRRVTFEFAGSRDFIKRLNYLAQSFTGHPACTMIHNSATYAMPYMSGYSVFLSGEQLNSGYFAVSNPGILPPVEEMEQGYYYCHVLPMDRLRAEGYPVQWGVPVAWLPQLKNHKAIMNSPVAARDLLSRLMQVDTLIWPIFINKEEVYKTWAFRKAFGIGDPEVSFTPYWENRTITAGSREVVIGYYQRPGRKLLIVSNLGNQPVQTTLHFGETPPQSVLNAETRDALPLSSVDMPLEIPRNDYVALLVTESSQSNPKDNHP